MRQLDAVMLSTAYYIHARCPTMNVRWHYKARTGRV